MPQIFCTLWQHGLVPWQWAAVIAATLIAAVTDYSTQRIPNVLTMPFFAIGIVWALAVGGWMGLADSLAGAVVTGAPFVAMFALAGGGAGDAKLMAAIGAWVGVMGGLVTLACVLIAGGIVAIVMAVAQRQMGDVLANVTFMLHQLRQAVFDRRAGQDAVLPPVQALHTMPYGLAIFFGACAASGVVLLWHEIA